MNIMWLNFDERHVDFADFKDGPPVSVTYQRLPILDVIPQTNEQQQVHISASVFVAKDFFRFRQVRPSAQELDCQ